MKNKRHAARSPKYAAHTVRICACVWNVCKSEFGCVFGEHKNLLFLLQVSVLLLSDRALSSAVFSPFPVLLPASADRRLFEFYAGIHKVNMYIYIYNYAEAANYRCVN